MNKVIAPFLFLLFIVACRDKKDESGISDSNLDAARNFIRNALDGKFAAARNYMLADSVNENYMDVAERSYQKADPEIKNGYRNASILIHRTDELNDSTAVIIYSNSYKNDHDTLRVVKKDKRWQVDLKYLYQHDEDSIYSKPALNDTIK